MPPNLATSLSEELARQEQRLEDALERLDPDELIAGLREADAFLNVLGELVEPKSFGIVMASQVWLRYMHELYELEDAGKLTPEQKRWRERLHFHPSEMLLSNPFLHRAKQACERQAPRTKRERRRAAKSPKGASAKETKVAGP